MTDHPVVLTQEGKKDTKFKKGVSGNPAGRPKGIKSQITLYKLALEADLRKQMKGEMGEILTKGLDLAKKGDKDMIRYFLDKWITQAKASTDDETPREPVQIFIGRLQKDEVQVQGRTFENETGNN